jgi:arylsulfatase A
MKLLTAALLLTLATSLQAASPNVIVIYTDDQGFGDTSCLNPKSKFQTPNIDRLANEGIRFTDAHCSDTVCTPSRYGLLTGRYCWRTEMKRGVLKAEHPCLITDDRMTLASLLRDNGYTTAMVGKWHLGMEFPGTPENRDWTQPVTDMPLDKGFDYFYGIPASMNYGILAWFEGRYAKVPPTLFTKKKPNKRVGAFRDYRMMPPYEETLKKGLLEVAPDFIDNQCLTRFTDKAIEWLNGHTAKSQKPFFLYLPYTSPHKPVVPLPEFQGQGKAGAYGEFMIETDVHVGRLLDYLDAAGLAENTMIVFSSDNGPETTWKERILEYQHYSAGIYRGGKRDIYEGGHRVPFFVRWPAGIKEPGRAWSKPMGQTDLLATFTEMLGVPLPDHAGEDSESFYPVLVNPDADLNHSPIIHHEIGGRFGIREGDWKLVMSHKKTPEPELYNLATDPQEINNVIADHPELVQALEKKITDIICRGRTTDGVPQSNDTDWWGDLFWMDQTEYTRQASRPVDH